MANLTQLRMLENLDGFLLVDKPAGIAYASVIKTVKRKFNLVKVGHGGSLDAAASGLLVLLVNDANKFVGDVMGADRSFTGTMRLGLRTNTHDIQGEPCGGTAFLPAHQEKIAAVIPEFKGDIFQTESRYCSIRKEGSAGYEVADTGDHKPFMTHVFRLDLQEPQAFEAAEGTKGNARLPFCVTATKGLLVKTLVNDFGDALGCGACLETLRRTRVGKFSVEDAVPFEKLLETEIGDFADLVLPLSKALA